jgi:Ca2+/Na+ antiporter
VTKKVGYRKEKDLASARAAAMRERKAEEAEARKQFSTVAIEFLSRVRTTTFFFSQGILAGISALLLILLVADSGDTVSFLHFFSPISRYVHGLLFWLTALCLMGAVDKLATDQICGWRGGMPDVSTRQVKVRDVAVLSLYGMSLILTFINAEVDLRFQYSESRAPSWYRDTPPPALFVDQMMTWHGLNAIRLVLLIFAWGLLLTDSQVHVMGAAAGEGAQNLAELLLQNEIALGEDAAGAHLTPEPLTPKEPEQRSERGSRRGSLRSSASTRSGRSSQAARRSTTPAA